MEQPGNVTGAGRVEKVEGGGRGGEERRGEGDEGQEPAKSKQLLTEALCARGP